ncbi:hypothetical protein IVA73_06270 [Bradyrhizobium sp. 131]|nr:hypothetical protein IVA73_06270 [Bradyrhizobium sp. 131]
MADLDGYLLGIASNHMFRSWDEQQPVAGSASAIAQSLPKKAWARRLSLRKMPFSFVAADSLYGRARLKPCCGGGQRAAIARAIMRRLILGFVAKSTSLGTCAAFEASRFLHPPFGKHSARRHGHAAHMERTLRFGSW